ncbi:MAG: glycosyltransferase family protein [Patescibacteria group bacterium]
MITTIIQARISSTRLPGKVLLPLGGKTVLENVVERVRKAKLIGETVVATSNGKDDDKIVELCETRGIKYFRGSLDDVLDRYYQTAKHFQAESICRITADCPLIDPEVIDRVAKKYLEGEYDYVSNTHPTATYPDGLDVEIFSFKALERAWQEAILLSEREHVTSYIWNNPDKFKIGNVKNSLDLSTYRLTIDENKDYELLKKIFKEVSNLTMLNIVKFLDERQDIKNINADITRDEGYYKSLENDKIKNYGKD